MNNIELILEDRFGCVNISKSGKYLFASKSTKCTLYDFQNRTKLFDIPVKYVWNSFFSDDEKFLILRVPSGFYIYNIDLRTVSKRISTGSSAQTDNVFHNNQLFYFYNNSRIHAKTLYKYDIESGERTTLIKDIKEHWNLYADGHTLFLLSNWYGAIEIHICTGKIERYSYSIPEAIGLSALSYSEFKKKGYYIADDSEQLSVYSFDVRSGISHFERSVPSNRKDVFFTVPYQHYLYLGFRFTSYMIDFLDENYWQEFQSFPLASLFRCDNPNYFYLFNAEYVTLYHIDN